MTTKHLTGNYPNGYELSAAYRKLVIDRTADVSYGGVAAPFFATVVNHGAVHGSDYGVGVYLGAGGSVTNGSIRDTAALIEGSSGVAARGAAATVTNFGSIFAVGNIPGGAGVGLYAGGLLTNGSTDDTTAMIETGYERAGVFAGAAATIANFGSIRALGQYSGLGVVLGAGGSIFNGSAQDTTALIYGYGGPAVSVWGAAATIANFGMIEGRFGNGVDLHAGGSLTNGSTGDTSALIVGYHGVSIADAAATIVNYGTIEGLSGVSVSLSTADCEVIAEAGSTFIGRIEGGGGTLDLAGGGTGTISGLGDGGTLTGAVQATFIHVDTFVIEAGGSWTLSGTNKVDPVADLVDAGTLINTGALTIAGTVSIDAGGVFRLAGGDISAGPAGDAEIVDYGLMIKNAGRGTITVAAHMFDRGVVEVATGTLDFTSRLFGTGALKIDAGATLEADAGAVSTLTATFAGGAATLALKRPNAFAATLAGFATGDVIDLLALKATGASVNGADQLVVVDGARTVATLRLSGAYAGASFTTAADGHGGTNVALAPAPQAGFPSVHGMAAAMASLAATAGVATLGHRLAAAHLPVLATPNVHLQ